MKDSPFEQNARVRHDFIAGSKRVKLFGRLNYNLFNVKRPLLPCRMEIEMFKNSPEFCLIRSKGVTDEYKVVIHSCKLNVDRVVYRKDFLSEMKKLMSDGCVTKFPYTKTESHTFDIPKGTRIWRSIDLLMPIPRPKRAYLVICEADSVYGNNWENNPMVFPAARHHVNYVQFYHTNTPLLEKAYEPDFKNMNCNKKYAALLKVATNAFKTGVVPGITPDDFVGMYSIFAIDTDLEHGDINIEIKFDQETSQALRGILFTQRDACFTMDKSGNVSHYR